MSWLAPIAQAWLVGIAVGLGLPLGALAISLIHILTGGLWGEEGRPALRRIARLLPVMLLCGLPLLGAIEALLPFLAQPPDALPPRAAAKLAYLQPQWIALRTLAVAVMWLIAWITGRRSRAAAVVGLCLYIVGLTIFTTDWMQALDPGFYSTIYPVEVAVAQLLGALALATILLPLDAKGDFGKLLLATVLSWAYFAAMQWVISWMGDLPDEAAWYVERTAGWWSVLLLIMLGLLVIVPFFALLPTRNRRDLGRLRPIAWLILVGYVLETVWRLAPAFAANPLIVVALLIVAAIFWIVLRPRPSSSEAQLV